MLVQIPAGTFLMGCATGRDEEQPVHQVSIDAFEMAVCQVTNRDYGRFLTATHRDPPPEWQNPDLNDPDQPVVSVSWHDAAAYCDWLGGYRLPTEAEWERAARGGEEGLLYVWGDEPPSARPDYQRRWTGEIRGPRRVGQEPPNAFGVCDLGENIHEWCLDWFARDYYARSPAHNPRGPESGDRKASRGGSWRHHIKVSRCAARSSIPPTFHYADYGFRVVREL